ncbi:hypothetical protein CRU99_03460 [Malaciobacter mytili]|uniref:hypothetical protein n=1 Tax=Malaciobacter mytili TaxID=603050 RepID=UPI00100A48B7|nr:hypothetical protein [Malaciobacter mytili]RXI45766.1 hypothetical protein CRU99_03460 [Malaciobacter mytili]
MSIWLCKKNSVDDEECNFDTEKIDIDDEVFIYHDDEIEGGFKVFKKLIITSDSSYKTITLDKPIKIDIPYSIFYKTKIDGNAVLLSSDEALFVLGENFAIEKEKKELKELFADYIKNSHLSENSKKITTRINYLEKIVPELIDSTNPESIFSITDIDKLYEIKRRLSSGGDLSEVNNSPKFAGQILQTMKMYLEFIEELQKEDKPKTLEQSTDNVFKTFLNKIEYNKEVKVNNFKNIEFIIGQPNTGKSYNFEESQIFDIKQKEHYKYLKIPVSGGIGNEYKGLQNTDLAITYDPIKKEVKFGEFLQVLMSAIVNPKVPHVIFLDDFHNQDISSLLSEYTPLFKSQQMRDIDEVDESHIIFTVTEYTNSDDFIKAWNEFIERHCKSIPVVPITNRISGESLKLVFPSNFYLLGAANFNENTLNIFADWEDRARITYKDPIETFTLENDESGFVECCKELNTNLRDILEKNKIYDYEKYCFGMWKIVEADGRVINNPLKQKETVRFLFGMIKNALRFNNKNSSINSIGWELFINMQSNDWFKANIKTIDGILDNIDYKILHEYNIYEDEI